MVVIIMALLMVSFLVGPQLQKLFSGSRSGENPTIGRVGKQDITVRDLGQARHDMGLLVEYAGLGQDIAFGEIRRNGPEARLAYCLLLREAENNGITASDKEVTQFLEDIGLVEEYYADKITEMRNKGISEDSFRELIARWLMIHKAFLAAEVNTPPSLTEARRLYRDLTEQINLRVVRISADDLLKDVPEKVADKEIMEQFIQYAEEAPGQLLSTDAFGFGYLVPNRVKIGYLLVDRESIRRALRPKKVDIEDYWLEHKSEFTKEVPIDPPTTRPTTKPTSQPASKPASQPASKPKTKTVVMSLAEARNDVIERMTPDMVEQRLDNVASIINSMRISHTGDDYEQILSRLIISADGVLSRTVRTKFTALPLDEAVAQLAEKAALTGIAYPWGEHGQYNLDPDILVSLDAKAGMTLAVALDNITAQAFAESDKPESTKPGATTKPTTQPATQPATRPATQPAAKPTSLTLRWAMCKGLENMLFCRGGDIDMFAVQAGTTDLLTPMELQWHPVLNRARTSQYGGASLVALAFSATEFGGQGGSGALSQGKDGPGRMFAPRGRILWRLLKAAKAHAAVASGARVDDLPAELRRRVVADVRMRTAFDRAIEQARKIEAKAQTDGLAAAVKAEKLETEETGLFARRTVLTPQRRIGQLVGLYSRFGLRFENIDLVSLPPALYPWSRVDAVSLPTQNLVTNQSLSLSAVQRFIRQLPPQMAPGFAEQWVFPGDMFGEAFMRKAFSLMPANLDKRGPGREPAVAVFLLPARREVYVMQRIDHVPAVAADFKDASVKIDREDVKVTDLLQAYSRWVGMRQWFKAKNIITRTEFTRIDPSDE